MLKTAFLLACLACASHSRPLQNSVAEGKAPLDALAGVLLGFQAPMGMPSSAARAAARQQRSDAPRMDFTLIQKLFSPGGAEKLKAEGRDKFWLTEIGWALYLDEEWQQSYNNMPRPSTVGYDEWAGVDIYSSPVDILKWCWKGLNKAAADPQKYFFPDMDDGIREWGPGQSSLTGRTIAIKEKQDVAQNMEPAAPGWNMFGIRTSVLKQQGKSPLFGFDKIFERSPPPGMSAVDDAGADEVRELDVSEKKANLAKLLKQRPQALASFKADKVSRRGDVIMGRSNFIPDMQRRTIMNLIVLGLVSAAVLPLVYGVIQYFLPPDEGGGSGVVAMDKVGNVITFDGWLKANEPNSRKVVQGIRGDATYLIVTKDKKLEDYGINAVCTHLGCVVPWNRAQNKFMCPCHGSQYDNTGKVVRGPAPLSLALAHVTDAAGKVVFTPWTEQDFRTGLNPWWKP